MIEIRQVEVRSQDEGQARTILAIGQLVLAEPRISVIGANGSGKSTLLRLINGLTLPDAGTVWSRARTPGRRGRPCAAGWASSLPIRSRSW
jgi:biotin transport system ATP-binding protein